MWKAGQLLYIFRIKIVDVLNPEEPKPEKSPNKKRRERPSYLDRRLKRLKNIAAANKKENRRMKKKGQKTVSKRVENQLEKATPLTFLWPGL